MTFLLDLFKGIAIGIANVVPGFSGGTMAVILKVYEKIINALNDITKHPIKIIKECFGLLLGVILGIVIASFTIVLLINIFPFQTIMFFVGLILGSIPSIYEKTLKYDNKLNKLSYVIAFIVCLVLMVVMPLINTGLEFSEVNPLTLIVVLLMGVISAAAMIIPGVSGSLILVVFGYYMLIMDNIKSFLENILKFNFSNIGNSALVLVAFAIGCVLGIIFVSKLIKMLLNKFPKVVYYCILGLLIGSIFSIIYTTCLDYKEVINFFNPFIYVFGFLTFASGTCLSYFMSNKQY